MSASPELPQPTPEERSGMSARSLDGAYAGWSEVQRAIYLAVWRGHARRSAVGRYLGLSDADITRELEAGMFGYLLWDRSQADPDLYIK